MKVCEICQDKTAVMICRTCKRKFCQQCSSIKTNICTLCAGSICYICQTNLAARACNTCGKLVCGTCSIKAGEATICEQCNKSRS